MKRVSPRALPSSAAVCLFLLALALPISTLAQNKSASKQKKPQADKTLSGTAAAPPVAVAPKGAAATHAGLLSPLEAEIIDEMNLARAEPQKYAAFVEEYKKYYNGNRLLLPGRQALVTAEGLAAVDEAVNFLRAAKPLPPLGIARGLCLAAKDHALDLAVKGTTGHKGSDGSTPNQRMERYGRWENVNGENIAYEVTTARQVVIGMIIDDGVANRGHRRNIFDANLHVAGININNSPPHGSKCVVTYAGGFTDKAASAGPAPKKY
ncbi:MAG TPA: CAP domain-containing protein [Pyrinomonadaceae bacterium]|nr:CAP domain-containing protein [Pyrinomonadaceae bacterium]